jgi:hypothetical protein
MIPALHVIGLTGLLAIGVALVVLARLSQRLGNVTHVRPYYLLLYVAACLVWGGAIVRLYFLMISGASLDVPNQRLLYTLLGDGLPAAGLTLGLLVTWFYWSWLLAERD